MKIVKPLPDPFLFEDGNRVRSQQDWQRRRLQIRQALLNIQYGTSPGPPDGVSVITRGKELGADGETREAIRLEFIPDRSRPDVTFGVDVNGWRPSKEAIDRRAESIPGFGEAGIPALVYVGDSVFRNVLQNGVAMLCFENNQLEPMEMGNPIAGPARRAYEVLEHSAYSWGSIAVWAWGASRVLEYAPSRPEMNPQQILVSGHSRNGKTALLAGALDERFSVVNPAGSGCAGAGSYLALGEGCEDLTALTSRERWWAWTHANFETWAGREEQLPFDQHFLMGLVAPRPLLRAEGTTDTWANPEGTCVSFLATKPIYEAFGVAERNGIFFHEGGHHHTEEDAGALVAFVAQHLFGIPPDHGFKHLILAESDLPSFDDWGEPPRF